jgi:Histidine kinase
LRYADGMKKFPPILAALPKQIIILVVLSLVAALIIKPYFGYGTTFPTLWHRLFIVAVVMLLTFMTTDWLWHSAKSPRISQLASQLLALPVGAFAGTVVSGLLMGRSLIQMFSYEPMLHGIMVFTAVSVGVGAVTAMVLIYRARGASADALEAQAALQRQALEKQVLEARLKLMQAQIEPHFLFNTLANVQHLVETNSPIASRVLADLITYLRAALPEMREGTTKLGREMEMSRAYLAIHAVRMGKRLQFEVHIPTAMKEIPFPPMMLLTLVENAIKHGVEPMQEGGSIEVSATDEDTHIAVSVMNTGSSINSHKGTGVGLKNVRDRLAALYGDRASLSLTEKLPSIVIATLRIPKQTEVT